MSEENQPPKRNHNSYQKLYPPIPPEQLAAIKSDWFTGQFNTEQLEAKYKVKRSRIYALMRFQWANEAKANGITPAKETKLVRRSLGSGFWNKVKLEYMEGKTNEELAIKYTVERKYLDRYVCMHGWKKERDALYDKGKAAIKASLQSTSAELAIKYDGFMRAAIEQIDVMTDKLKVMSAEGTCTPDRLKTMVDSLGSIINMGMKIYGMEKPQTQVNNQFIRLDVLDSSASTTMNHLAKTLDIKTA